MTNVTGERCFIERVEGISGENHDGVDGDGSDLDQIPENGNKAAYTPLYTIESNQVVRKQFGKIQAY